MRKLLLGAGIFLCCVTAAETQTLSQTAVAASDGESTNVVQERVARESKIFPNSFAIAFHEPTYILPYYYTGSPYNSIYKNNTPDNESLKSNEIKYQISFKVPVWKNILDSRASLYLAYTQLSYWQAYNKRAFFRETDYEPELFFATDVNAQLTKNWRLNFLNVGTVHQSNGQGGSLERSWNRAYLAGIASTGNWVIGVKPWIIFRDSTYLRQNPDMATYLGYEEVVIAYKYANQVFSLETRNFFESLGKRAGSTLSWSFPLTPYLKGYVQVFSGYGQSLIEYNHRTNSAGIGIALSNWV